MAARLRIGARPSALALAQARKVADRLSELLPDVAIGIVPVRTTGDRLAAPSLARIGGKGLFVKEIEEALSDGRIDIGVHSMKDLPAVMREGFRIVAVPAREDPRDVLVVNDGAGFAALCRGARVGTASERRRFQALRERPDLEIVALRGNVDTRLARLESGEVDAIVLALAGLRRIGRAEQSQLTVLDEQRFIPAGGQGALAIEAVAGGHVGDSAEFGDAVASLNDPCAECETAAERAFLSTIGASCATPVGVRAKLTGQQMEMRTILFDRTGSRWLEDTLDAPMASPADGPARTIGAELGRRMLACGAAALIA